MQRRRAMQLAAGGVLAAGQVRMAAAAPVVAQVGLLSLEPMPPAHVDILKRGLHAAGWDAPRRLRLDVADADGDAARLPAAASRLAMRGPDLIVASGSQSALAVREAAPTVPVVFFYVGDPVGTGLVASQASPGGMATGFGGLGPALHTKMLQLLLEAVPAARRVGVFHNPDFPTHRLFMEEVRLAAASRSLTLLTAPVRGAPDIDPAADELGRQQAQALLVLAQPRLVDHGAALARAARRWRLASISGLNAHAADGLLMSYSWRLEDDLARVPDYVDRILRGTPPAALPVQQPQRFHLTLNAATAHALGLSLPPTLRTQADQVVE